MEVHQDNKIDLTISAPRFDICRAGDITKETPQGTSPGPRQRRFRFDALVIRDSVVKKLREQNRPDLADPIDDCHRDSVYKRCCGCRLVKQFFNRCERFYCPVCAQRLARDRRETVDWWAKVVNSPKHVILTVLSIEILSKAYVRQLKDDFRRLRARAFAKRGRKEPMACICPWALEKPVAYWRAQFPKWIRIWVEDGIINRVTTKWRGGFWSIDVTHNPTGFHVHFHAIVDADWVDQELLEAEWSNLRKQAMSIVRVIDVKGKNYTAEACKYVTDGVALGNWPADKIVEFCDSLGKERCFDTFGALYKQRAEWTAEKAKRHADRQICECGCSKWEFLDENEWEWQQAKSSLAPPAPLPRPTVLSHPELFAPRFTVLP